MMWLVNVALRRPLSIAVMALLMLVLGVLSFAFMNADIFPSIDLAVVMVVWNYPGLSAIDVERRMVIISERAYSTTVNDIEHIESQSIEGLGLLKVYFQPDVDIGAAIAQINAVSQTILTLLPRGTQPPQIISYNASNVPVAQLNVFSDTLSTRQLFDYGLNFIRVQLFTIPGFSTPAPLGGVNRAIMVNLDPTALYARGLSPQDVGTSLAAQNVVIPSGQAKMGDYQYNVAAQTMPPAPLGSTTALLERRPDLQQAEQTMVRANAEIGVAVASFFPTVGLSALYGGESAHVGDVLKRSSSIWSVAADASGPLFQGGRLLESYYAQKAFWDEAIARYRAAVVESFREVADALAAQQTLREQRAALEHQVRFARRGRRPLVRPLQHRPRELLRGARRRAAALSRRECARRNAAGRATRGRRSLQGARRRLEGQRR